jgi:hypothetical protein
MSIEKKLTQTTSTRTMVKARGEFKRSDAKSVSIKVVIFAPII